MRLSILTLIFVILITNTMMADDIHKFAAAGKQDQIVKLLDAGVPADSKVKNGKTALHFAAQFNRLEVIALLIKRGANPDARNNDQSTPLHYAVFMGHLNAAKRLIELKANVDLKDRRGMGALDIAVSRRNPAMVGLLLSNNVELSKNMLTPRYLHNALTAGLDTLAEAILKRGVDPQSLSPSGGNLYHSSAIGGVIRFIKSHKKLSIDPNLKDQYGQTPSDYAEKYQRSEIANALKKLGAVKVNRSAKESRLTSLDTGDAPQNATLFLPGILSSHMSNERDMTISNDLSTLYFSRNNAIYSLKFTKKGIEGPRKASFGSAFPELEAAFSPDNRKIFFISRRPMKQSKKPGPWEIWYVDIGTKKKRLPKPLGEEFKSCFYPSLTKDKQMYYTDANNDIWYASYMDGAYRNPVKLGPQINTKQMEYNAFIARDGRYLIFTSFAWGAAKQGGDLFISFKDQNGKWTKAMNMGKEINSPHHEYCPSVSPDGKSLFFTSNRNGNEDIYWMDAKIIDKLKNKR